MQQLYEAALGGRIILGLALSFALAVPVALAAGEAELCDALAGDGPAGTVPFEAIDADAAVAACGAAVALEPANSQLIHQYARALERAGRLEEARRLYGWAAADGYPAAGTALVRLEAAADPGWTEAEREDLTTAMAAIAAAVRRYGNSLPPEPTDPLTVLAVTGTDPSAIAQWIGTETILVPYVGSLRGPRGVLLDHAGNSLDRALALATLLNQAGEEVRIARATLDDAQAEALFAAAGERRPHDTLPAPSPDELRALLSDPRLPPELVDAAIQQLADRGAAADEVLRERTELLVNAVLPDVATNAAPADEAARDAAIAALRDYFWVQIRAGTAWRDVVPDAAAGAPVAAETFAVDAVPPELRHSVTIRVILELQDRGGRREETLLTHTVYPADTGYQTLSLSHISPAIDAMDQAVAGGGDVAARILGLLEGATMWTPVLEGGDEAIVERLFTHDGELRDADAAAIAQTGAAMGALFGEVGDLLDGVEPVATEPSIPTAEWIEIAVGVPGQPERIERRTVFDVVGPAARAAGTPVVDTPALARERALGLVGTTDILIVGATPSPLHLARVEADVVARIADTAIRIAGAPTLPALDEVEVGPKAPLALLAFAGRRLGEPLTAPNVFLSHFRLSPTDKLPTTGFDIVFNDLPDRSFEEQVRQGVVDTTLEDALLTGGQGPNVATLHAADLAAGRSWTVVTDVGQLGAVGPDAIARIAADLAAGNVVIAPALPSDRGDFGWWRIDPLTGRTLGIMADGGGATLVENAFLALQGAATGMCFAMVGMSMAKAITGGLGAGFTGATMIACAAAGASGALGAGGGLVGEAAAGAALGVGFGGAVTALMILVAQP